MLRLRVDPADGARFEYPFQGRSLVIGRSSSADLVLADRFLSRQHARLFLEGEQLMIEDLGSRNGTLVNGRKSEGPTKVLAGDVIKLSGSSISVVGVPRPLTASSPLGGTIFRAAADLLSEANPVSPEAIADEAALRRQAQRLQILNEVHAALGRSVALDELLGLILDRSFEHLGTEEGAIYLREAGGEIRLAASRPNHAAGSYPYSRTLIREVTEKKLAALVLDARTDERFAGAQSMLMSGIRSLVAAPLLSSEDAALGMIVLNSRASVRRFRDEDMELLVSLAAVAALRIENVALAEEAAQRQRLEEELALARRIQMALLPDQLPEVAGYELHASNEPSRGVSGDYYLAVTRPRSRAEEESAVGEGGPGEELVLVIADVSGKGIAAALLTATLEALSAGPIEEGRPPGRDLRAPFPGSSFPAPRPRSTPPQWWRSSTRCRAGCATPSRGTTRRSWCGRKAGSRRCPRPGLPSAFSPSAPTRRGRPCSRRAIFCSSTPTASPRPRIPPRRSSVRSGSRPCAENAPAERPAICWQPSTPSSRPSRTASPSPTTGPW